MPDNNVAARLKLFLDYKGLSNSQFADLCGIPRPTLSQLFSGRNKKISDLLIGQIHGIFPELSVLWLLFGEGEMHVGSNPGTSYDSNENIPDGSANTRMATGPIPDGGIASDTEPFVPYGSHTTEYESLDGLGSPVFTTNSAIGQRDTSNYRMRELERKIDNLKKNPRKVVQITVYYDDNTFETFRPA